MKPEPWGLALDEVAAATERPTIIFPSPAGEVFTQATARDLATREHIVFGCGRYEGIDERVFEYAAALGEVRLISLGDYVLNGGEVATMAMIEAIGRLVPGVVGNPESLVEESHEDGLLEYPRTRSRRSGGSAPFRRCSSAGTTPASRSGAVINSSSARERVDRTCSPTTQTDGDG